MSTVVGVELGERRYDVAVGVFAPEEVADRLAAALPGATAVAVLADAGLARASGRLRTLVTALSGRWPALAMRELPAGEAAKTLAEVGRTAEWLAAQRLDRRSALLGIGGGAAGDHAGFCAAIYLRGIRFALCPTTLLAAADASVGGKTAVDLPCGKNLIGAFHQPSAVVSDLGFLETLGSRARSAGMAEVVKCGLVADEALFVELERLASRGLGADAPPSELEPIVAAAVRVKARVVEADETETDRDHLDSGASPTRRRVILNFGHTIGHALETESGFELLHGEAVALGMLAALDLGERRGVTRPGLGERVKKLLESFGLPVDWRRRLGVGALAVLSHLDVDKKRRGAGVRFVFCRVPGEPVVEEVPLDELRAALLPSTVIDDTMEGVSLREKRGPT